jgi:hypothetical protein
MSSLSSFGLRAAAPASEAPAALPAQVVAGSSASRGAGPERRRYARVPLALRGRYMLEDGHEYPCVTRDISRMGVALEGAPVGAIGERVIAYLEQLGRIEGRVVRRSENWFAIEVVATPQKLDRLEEKISAIVLRSMRDGLA